MVEVRFTWQSVIKIFAEEFSSVFTYQNKQKLYFSFEEKVEGAMDNWMLLAFVDGILQNLEPTLVTGMNDERLYDFLDYIPKFNRFFYHI